MTMPEMKIQLPFEVGINIILVFQLLCCIISEFEDNKNED